MHKPVGVTMMPRRAFLAWGSALAAGALGGKAFAASALPVDASTTAQADFVAVGYGAPMLADASHIIEARSLSSGDAEFVRRGARVTIFGLEGMESTPDSDGITSFALDVAYSGTDGVQPLLVHAWRFAKGPVAHFSPSTSFVVPVEGDSGLNLILETTDAAGVAKRTECRFTVGIEPGLPKLLRGLYALAPSDASSWRGLAWSLGDGGRPRLSRRGVPGGEAAGVDFPCLTMTVDYANHGAERRA